MPPTAFWNVVLLHCCELRAPLLVLFSAEDKFPRPWEAVWKPAGRPVCGVFSSVSCGEI